MNFEQFKELWTMRFKKILKGEEEAIAFYCDLLSNNKTILENTPVKMMLEQILKDEGKHVQIARELVRFVDEKIVPKKRKR